jgi:hypothetical protein
MFVGAMGDVSAIDELFEVARPLLAVAGTLDMLSICRSVHHFIQRQATMQITRLGTYRVHESVL